FNRSINVVWYLQGPYRLESDRKYTYRDMQERFAQSVFGPEYDLEYLAKAGHIKWRKSVRERYPRTFLKPRSPIYYEHFIEAGEQLGQLVQELGFDFDLTDHKPLPAWRPGPAHKESNPKFDLYSVPFRVPFLTHMWLTHNPWLVELAEHHPWAFKIVMNATTAAKKGIKDGDHIVVEGSTGYKVEGIAKLTQCIHPEVVALSRHGGHWCSSSPIAKGKGTNFNALVPHTMEYIDPVFGSLEGCVKVSVSKTAGG
ncbi:MAG: molybdopterin dinucleotide binding domain-containing protein, partial [Dehalococcoidia bacterium]|nr:molybdopterin dinucleotide binding domain-containing protein [Dehalococcoidia bacterium]